MHITVQEHLDRDKSSAPSVELRHQGGSGISFHAGSFERFAYDAAKEGKSVVPVDWNYEASGLSIKAWVLVDIAARYAYGLRFEMKTTTSSLVAERRIPNLY